jgi:tetratricopeptide (TPR) repeat protein
MGTETYDFWPHKVMNGVNILHTHTPKRRDLSGGPLMPNKNAICLLIVFAFIVVAIPNLVTAQEATRMVFSQESSQTTQITPPPIRRIEPPPADASPAELEERGDQLRGEKAYLDALDYYQAAMKKLPKEPAKAVVLNKMGMAQIQMSRFDEAKKSFEKSLKIDKTYSKAQNNLGSVYYRNKKYGRAVKYFKRAIELEPDAASFHGNLASAYVGLKDLEKAVPEYQRALQLDPDVFERHSSVGIVAQMSPEDRAHYSYLLAKMYAQAGQFDRSLLYLRRAIEDGYKDVNNAMQDAEFAQLRKDPRFNELMTQKPTSIQ